MYAMKFELESSGLSWLSNALRQIWQQCWFN